MRTALFCLLLALTPGALPAAVAAPAFPTQDSTEPDAGSWRRDDADAAYAAGDFEKARDLARARLDAVPDDAQASLMLGLALEGLGDGDADAAFERALEHGADDAAILLQVADVHSLRYAARLADTPALAPDSLRRAKELYGRLARLPSDDADAAADHGTVALGRLAWLCETGGDVDGAKALRIAAIARDPQANEPHFDLWKMLGNGLTYDELASFYDGLAAVQDEVVVRARMRFYQAQVLGAKAEASRGAARAAEGESDIISAARQRNEARAALVDAVPLLETAAALDPALDAEARKLIATYRVERVEIYGDQHDVAAAVLAADEARAALDPLLRDAPDDASVRMLVDRLSYGIFVASGGEGGAAPGMEALRGIWQWATSIVTDNAEWWNNYGFFGRESKAYEEAYLAYRHCIELEPENVRYVNDTGLILFYCLDRDLDEAERLFRRAIELGEAQYPAAKDDPAREWFVRSAFGDALLNLGRMTLKQGRFDVAKEAFERLAKLDPGRADLLQDRIALAVAMQDDATLRDLVEPALNSGGDEMVDGDATVTRLAAVRVALRAVVKEHPDHALATELLDRVETASKAKASAGASG